MATVTFRNVSKAYGGAAPVIEGLDLGIRDREFMVLVGPSGCGKSTALRMLAGLEEVTGGEIAIGDRVVNDVAPRDRDIAMVFQSYALYPHMTIRENLEFGLKMRKVPREERDRLVSEAAAILGLDELLGRRPAQLSGGQRQRVALGRAIVRKPAVFLFDEPLSNLDAKLRGQMRAEIKKLQRTLETTTVYVTHDQVEAMTMGSRIAVMRAGKIQQVGEPLEIYDRPSNVFVAGFIGTPPMNLLPARIEDGCTVLDGDVFSVPVPPPLARAAGGLDGTEVLVGIRPETFRRSEGGPFRAVVEVVEPLGDEVVVHALLGDRTIVCKLDPGDAPLTGETIRLAVDLDRVHVFDRTTERRLEP